MGAGASVPHDFPALSIDKQQELKGKFIAAATENERLNNLPKGEAEKKALHKLKMDYFNEEIEAGRPLTVPLVELQVTIDAAIAKGKTPLVIDSSEEDKVNTFYTYQSVVMLDGKKMGLDKSLKKIPVQDIMEGAREKLVNALKFGLPLVVAMTKSVTDFALTFTDEVAGPNGTLDISSGKYFPAEVFKNAGKGCLSEAYIEDLFRAADRESGIACSRNPDGFFVVLTSQFTAEDYDEYLFGNDWGLPKPREQYQAIIIDDSKTPVTLTEELMTNAAVSPNP